MSNNCKGQVLLVCLRADGGYLTVSHSARHHLRGHAIQAAWLHGDVHSAHARDLLDEAAIAMKGRDRTIPPPTVYEAL